MEGQRDRNNSWPSVFQSFDAPLTTMRRPVIHNPKHPFGGLVRFLGHDLSDQAAERFDTYSRFTPAKDFGAMNIPSRQVGQSPTAGIFMFNSHGLATMRAVGFMFSNSSLEAGLFISGNNVFTGLQRLFLLKAMVQIQNPNCFLLKKGIAWEYPSPMLPGPDGPPQAGNQRHIVVPLMLATIPLRMTSRAISKELNRDNGTPLSQGSSQARALTCTTT